MKSENIRKILKIIIITFFIQQFIIIKTQTNTISYPIIWRKSKHQVATQYIQAQVDIHLKSPCKFLNSTLVFPHNKNIKPEDDKEERSRCEGMYQQIVIHALQKHCTPLHYQQKSKPKRSILTFAGGVVATIIVVAATIGYDAFIKSQSGVHETSMSEAELYRIEHQINTKMVKAIIELQQEMERLKHLAYQQQIPSLFLPKFYQLETIIHEVFSESVDKPIPKAFFQLFNNLSICDNCPPENWHLENCKIYAAREPSDSLLRLNINAVQIDKRYEILRADPFHLIVNDKLNSSNLCISIYTGPSYSVMDKDTKCVKSIMFNPFDDHQAPFIFHSLKCNNDLQKFGAKWRTMDCKPKEEITSEEIVQVKTDENFVYYYCFLHNITLQHSFYPCKNQIYKSKLGQNLTINNQTIKFHKIKINIIHNLHDEFNELINFRIFNNFNSSVNLQDLTTLVEQEDKLIDKIVVSYFSQYYLYIIITILTIIILITMMLFTYYRIRARSYQRVAREQYQLAHLRLSRS
ncbi:uncharacterized protein LOC142646185 [Dermatophagoides pteronyssinus]|uniref:uncharacterized protein LOC142646185 n=1 Tax=Dermatophagoides pteronyssinus TaxID=6956 RepID=UPI003F66DB61